MNERRTGIGLIEWALLLVLSVLWGGSFFFAKVAVGELPPLSIVLGRVAIAAAALHILIRVTGRHMPSDLQSWMRFTAMGLLNNLIPFSLIFWAQTSIDSGLAAILIGATPLFTVILAHYLAEGERLSWNRLTGVSIGFVGLAFMIGVEVLAGFQASVLAEGAVILAAISYAAASVFGRRFRNQPPLITATGQITASALIALPIAILADRPWLLPMPDPVTISAVVALALLSTALAYVIFFRILAKAGATYISLVTLLVPVSALLLGHAILAERLAPHQFAGMGLIATGLILIDDRVHSVWRSPASRS
jgi:drug/metabolite transporter (DMT)-like permease